MRWRRARRIALIVVACLVVLGAVFLWALPEIVRRVALDQIPKRTGRAASLEKVELNLFTGRVALHKFRLDEREGREPFVELDRLSLRLAVLPLLRSHLVVRDLSLTSPSVHVVKLGPGQFNFSDLLEPSAKTEPAQPSRWTMTVEQLNVSGGTVRVEDRAVSPAAEWLIRDFGVDALGITTRHDAGPGRLEVQARIAEASFGVKADGLSLDPLGLHAKVSLSGFELRRLVPYVFSPLGTPYEPSGGRLAVALDVRVESDAAAVRKAALSGTVTVEGHGLVQTGRPDAFFSVSRLAVDIKEADALARSLTVASIAIQGVDVKARRDAAGVIDLLALTKAKAAQTKAVAVAPTSGQSTPAPPAVPSPPAAPAPGAPPGTLGAVIAGLQRGFEKIRIERITLSPSTATLVDEGVTPKTTLALTNLEARIDDVTWPVTGPATLALSTGLPGGGTLAIKGPVIVQPFDADLVFTLRNAPVEPYQAYLGVPARVSGRFSGDSRNHIALRDGATVLASKGSSWAENVEVRAPGSTRPMIRVERMEVAGIDFDWPKRAAVARASFRRPRAEIERAADGTINIRSAFTSAESPAPTAPAPAPAPRATAGHASGAGTAAKPKSLLETIQLEFKEVRIEDGFVRFLDRTTKPAYSEDLSKLDVTLTGLTNRPGQRAHLVLKSAVGGDGALDIRGEVAPLGAAPFVDLVGELRRFKLASVDPYAASSIGWVIRKGELQYRLALKLENNALTLSNDVLVGQLQVAPASGTDEVKQRIGLPLGLIVALIKDGKGEIHFTVPVTGSLKDPKFDVSDAIWTAVKNVLVNVVKAPFRAIGRLFSGGGDEKLEEPKVDPVTFAAGSAVLSPEMEEHLVRVANFLRRSPFVNLALVPSVSSADGQALRREAVTGRVREFQKERKLADSTVAIAAYFKERVPDVPLPKTAEEQLAVLEEREPAPEPLLAELGRRRVEATRARLVETEGIPAARLATAGARPAPAAAPAGEGRVEFAVEAAGE